MAETIENNYCGQRFDGFRPAKRLIKGKIST